jgi:hypothetical protein
MHKLTVFGIFALSHLAHGATPKLPGFTVEVSLSDRARHKLVERKETILAVSYFTASPRKGITPKSYKKLLSRPGPLGLGEVEVEAKPGESLRFGAIRLDSSALAVIDGQGPRLLLNVVSGRRSSEDNLLLCDIFEGSLESVQRTVIPIACKLIEEQDHIKPTH